MYVVAVLFETHAPTAFREAILPNAAASLNEPGCLRFDVAFADGGRRCFLYELYDDEAAFKFHLSTPHFLAFDAACQGIVTNKRVEIFTLEGNPLATRGPRA